MAAGRYLAGTGRANRRSDIGSGRSWMPERSSRNCSRAPSIPAQAHRTICAGPVCSAARKRRRPERPPREWAVQQAERSSPDAVVASPPRGRHHTVQRDESNARCSPRNPAGLPARCQRPQILQRLAIPCNAVRGHGSVAVPLGFRPLDATRGSTLGTPSRVPGTLCNQSAYHDRAGGDRSTRRHCRERRRVAPRVPLQARSHAGRAASPGAINAAWIPWSGPLAM